MPEFRGPGLAAALGQALRALSLRRARADLYFGPGPAFLLLLAMLAVDVLAGWFAVAGRFSGWAPEALRGLPRTFTPEGLITTFAGFGAALLAAWLAVRVLRRPAAFWSLAAPLLAAWLLFSLLATSVTLAVAFSVEDPWGWYLWLRRLYLALWLLVAWRLLAGFAAGAALRRRGMAVLPLLLLAGGLWLHAWPDYWVPDFDALPHAQEPDVPALPPIDHEAVMYAQPALLHQALEALAPQRPEFPDLYAVGFAGDGTEAVFSNEVRYFGELAASRYGAAGRTMALVNDPDSATEAPIATLTALRQTLAALGARMDVDEDVLLLFLTTHGSEDHRLLVQLGELPLTQVQPQDLAGALEESGIRWRIVIVSACYSGGFIDALADPYTMVFTAARADRTSFGCGVASDITWFGQAFLVDALNRERNPVAAFALASDAIAAREQAEDITPSDPQMHLGQAIAERLPAWLAAWPDEGPVRFQPAH